MGKVISGIAKIAKPFLPILKMIPGPVGMIAGAAEGFMNGGGWKGALMGAASGFLGPAGSLASGAGNNIFSSILSAVTGKAGSGGIADIVGQLAQRFTQPQQDTQMQETERRNAAAQAAYYQARSYAA